MAEVHPEHRRRDHRRSLATDRSLSLTTEESPQVHHGRNAVGEGHDVDCQQPRKRSASSVHQPLRDQRPAKRRAKLSRKK
jgi:hypothetical protein